MQEGQGATHGMKMLGLVWHVAAQHSSLHCAACTLKICLDLALQTWHPPDPANMANGSCSPGHLERTLLEKTTYSKRQLPQCKLAVNCPPKRAEKTCPSECLVQSAGMKL